MTLETALSIVAVATRAAAYFSLLFSGRARRSLATAAFCGVSALSQIAHAFATPDPLRWVAFESTAAACAILAALDAGRRCLRPAEWREAAALAGVHMTAVACIGHAVALLVPAGVLSGYRGLATGEVMAAACCLSMRHSLIWHRSELDRVRLASLLYLPIVLGAAAVYVACWELGSTAAGAVAPLAVVVQTYAFLSLARVALSRPHR